MHGILESGTALSLYFAWYFMQTPNVHSRVTQFISDFRQEQQKWAELTKHKQRRRAFHWEILPNSNLSCKTRISSMFMGFWQRWEPAAFFKTHHKFLLQCPKPRSKRLIKAWTWRERCIFCVSVIFKFKSLDIFNRHGKKNYLALLSNCRRKLYQKNNVACSVFTWFHLAFQFYFSYVSFSLFFFLNNHHVLVIHISHQHRNKSCKYNTAKQPSLLIDMPNG